MNKLYLSHEWGMFTTKGNKRVYEICNALLEEVQSTEDLGVMSKSLDKFFKSLNRVSKSKTMGEVSDTDVRDQLHWFIDEVSSFMPEINPDYLHSRLEKSV